METEEIFSIFNPQPYIYFNFHENAIKNKIGTVFLISTPLPFNKMSAWKHLL